VLAIGHHRSLKRLSILASQIRKDSDSGDGASESKAEGYERPKVNHNDLRCQRLEAQNGSNGKSVQ
jgi:hypothetical protein